MSVVRWPPVGIDDEMKLSGAGAGADGGAVTVTGLV